MATVSPPSQADPSADPPGDLRLRAAWEAISRPDVKVVSTDVFDTLVWRQVAEPADAFALLADRLLARGRLAPGLSAESFQSLRRLAEDQARQYRALAHNDLEVTLAEIYERIPAWAFAHASAHGSPAELELSVEHELIVPDLDVVAVLRAAAAAGKRVVAVSDTYFSEAQLRGLLEQPGLEELELDHVFTSSDHRCSKVDGLLGVMLSELDVPAAAVVHLGDSAEADVAPAQALGLGAVPFERHPADLVALLRAEARFAEPRPAGRGAALLPELTSLRGKVAARAAGDALPSALRPFWRTGALVFGPVMAGFAEWVQERAAEHGVTRLLCFMREGELLTGLLDRAGQAQGLGARAERLWLNRETLAVATIGEASRGEIASLLVRRRAPSVSDLVVSLGLTMADVPGLATHADTRLDDAVVRENLLDLIEADPALVARIAEHARRQRARVVDYVTDLVGDARTIGVVDLGWGATAQGMLHSVLAAAGHDIGIVGLYLATHEGAASTPAYARGFLGEFGAPREAVRVITRTPEILEQLCMPDHGPQIGLDELLQPVLAPAAHDRLQMVEADALRQGVEAFQREWARYRAVMPGKLPSLGGGAHVLRPLLIRQLQAPTELEATLLGGWAHDENRGSERTEEIADLRHAARLRHLAPGQLRKVSMEDLYWPAGLAARVDAASAELFGAAAAGEISWESLSSRVETGRFRIEAAGTDIAPDSAIDVVPERNRFGLSEVFGQITAPAIAQLVIRPTEGPAVLRLDYLRLRCHVQGEPDTIDIALDDPADFARLTRSYCYLLNPNVFVVHSHSPELRLDLGPLTPRTVYRVEVHCGFALLGISQLLPTPGRLRSVEEAGVRVEALERELAQMRASPSWRLTRPLRLLKRLLG